MNTRHPVASSQDCDAILELIPDYAFGLTSAEDSRLVESRLESCPDAAAQLADFRSLQDEMRASVAEIEPPPHLAERLRAAIATPPQAANPTRRDIRWSWLAAAAATIALIVTNAYWLARVDGLTRDDGGSESRSAQTTVQGDSTFTLTNADNLRWVRLPPSQQNTRASAVLMWNVESEIGLLYVRGFPELSVGKTFQLWLTRGEERASAGTFRVDEQGNGALLFRLTEPLDKYTWARITEEPEDGSAQPSDQVVVIGEL